MHVFFFLDRIATWTSHSGSEIVNALRCDSFLRIRAPANGSGGMEIGSTRTYGLSPVLLPSVSLQGTPITLLTADTPSALPMKRSALLFLIPSRIPNFYLRFILFMRSVEVCLANTFSLKGTNSCDGFLPRRLSTGVVPSRPF